VRSTNPDPPGVHVEEPCADHLRSSPPSCSRRTGAPPRAGTAPIPRAWGAVRWLSMVIRVSSPQSSGIGGDMEVQWWSILPFVVMLLTIALAPLIPATAEAWEKQRVQLL